MEFPRAKIISCVPLDNYKLWILFDDGIEGVVDLKSLAGKGVFAVWNSIDCFNSVYIDKRKGTVAWGKDLDLDPYVLHDQVISDKKQKNFP